MTLLKIFIFSHISPDRVQNFLEVLLFEMKILNSSRGVEVPVINFQGHQIWGATSMILSEFSLLLKNM